MTDPIAWPCAEVAGTIAGVGEMVTVFRPLAHAARLSPPGSDTGLPVLTSADPKEQS